MWIIYAFASAVFAGLTSILAKCGIKKADSNVATALRTVIVLVFSWLMVFVAGSQGGISGLSSKTWIFLVLSGISTGASWLCYFRALKTGDINKVVPIDKSSTILTILLSFAVLGEKITLAKCIAVLLMAFGTYLMLSKKQQSSENMRGASWLVFAAASAVFAAMTAILGKIGIEGVESNLGTAIRTSVVLPMSWLVVFTLKKQHTIRQITAREYLFIAASGLATGASWLCFYKALKDGTPSAVVAVDKLSVLVTVAFSFFVFKERLTKKSAFGLALIVASTFLLLIK